MDSLIAWASAFLSPRQAQTDEEEGGGRRVREKDELGSRHRPPGPTCVQLLPFYDPTVRTELTFDTITLYGWPSRGGIIVLLNVTAVDFDFLGLDPLDPPLRRPRDQDAEDAFCRRLLLLGAKWWDSEARYHFLVTLDSQARDALDEDRAPHPTPRERRWVKVGWPSEPRGGVWVAEFDSDMYGIEEEEDLVPEDAARVMLARNMDERCEVLRTIGGRFFASLEEYEGHAFLKAWEEKVEGEVGPLVKGWSAG